MINDLSGGVGTMQQRAARYLSIILYAAAVVGGILLTVKFLLPWTAPFLVAFGAAALLEPVVSLLVHCRWKRPAASGLLTLAALGAIGWAVTALGARCISAVAGFARRVPELMGAVGGLVSHIEQRILSYISNAPEDIAVYLEMALDAAAASLNALPTAISQWVLDLAARAAQSSPGALLFIVTAGIGTYFFSSSFPRAKAFAAAQLPEGLRHRLAGLGQDLKGSFGGFMRAQLILMVMTFFELLAAFLLLRVDGAAGLAALTCIIDALPVFGAGIVLLPWALYSLLLGGVGRGIGLAISWAVITLVRSCVQAKLLGDQIGLDPLASLLAIYVGWRVWGVWGMLLFPILLVTLRQLNDKGVIRLWKQI